MVKAILVALAITSIALLGANPARATVLKFDQLAPEGAVPNGYGGFNWGNFQFLNGVNFDLNPSGYQAGVVSPNNVAYNADAFPAGVSINGATQFNFVGAYLTAAWNDDLSVRIQGFSIAAPVYDTTVILSATTPTFYTLNFANVDEVLFTSFGGTQHFGYEGTGLQFAMDDFTFTLVPEPSSLLLGFLGLAALAFVGAGARHSGRRAKSLR